MRGCDALRRDSTCVGDCRSPRGDLATGPVHCPLISFSVKVNTRVSGFTTSLIIVGPVTTPSDRLCRCCPGTVSRALKMTLCHLGAPVTRSPPRALTTALGAARSSSGESTHHHETCQSLRVLHAHEVAGPVYSPLRISATPVRPCDVGESSLEVSPALTGDPGTSSSS